MCTVKTTCQIPVPLRKDKRLKSSLQGQSDTAYLTHVLWTVSKANLASEDIKCEVSYRQPPSLPWRQHTWGVRDQGSLPG